ncbi:MAG TPA: molybdopterin converting factor subunit 1 [Verrucomicrobiae bacterium]|jgi:molybdopterin converting factor subunit 1|nr:molybdopterin converting factor subunit 1 [Verrucomicrobiae bacterium]
MHVLFFAQLKDATGCDSIEIELSSPQNCEQLWKFLIENFPALAHHQKNTRLARNWEYVDAETVFVNEDEVALIPPVSGG